MHITHCNPNQPRPRKVVNSEPMKRLLALLLIAAAFTAQSQTAGRVWLGGSIPATKPTSFATGDVWRDTVAKISYRYKSGWYIPTDQLSGGKGDRGDTGATGAKGADGVCPPCPTGTAPASFGKMRFVGTESELKSAVAGFGDGSVTSVYVTTDIGITSPIYIPKIVNTRAKKVCIYLNGNAIYDASASGLPYGIARLVTTQDSALNLMQDVSVIIRDGELIGKGVGTAFDVASTYGTIVEGVDVTNWQDGYQLRFCLMAGVRNCLAGAIRNEAFVANMGNWTGADGSNSQSNSTRFEQCRVFNYPNAKSAFSAYAASGIIYEQCISEGDNSQYGWYIDGKSSSVVKDGLIHMGHSENTPSKAHVYVSLLEGVYQIDGLFHQYKGTLLDANSTGGYPHYYVRNIPYMVTGSQFKVNGNNCIMSFDELPSTYDCSSSANWVGGVVPYYLQQKGLNQSPYWIAPRLTINGKAY